MKSSRVAARQAQAIERLETKVDELTKMVRELLAQSKAPAPKRVVKKAGQ